MTAEELAMDDLQFRRTIYADPNCTDESVKKAAAADSAKQEFWDELRSLNAKMQQASKVEVPENLANKLILRQTLESHKIQKRQTRWHLALAASVAFVFGISFTLWQQTTVVNLGEHALAHVYHENDGAFALKVNGDISLDSVNARLASLGASFTEDMGRIYFANFCDFDKIRSFHMVMEGENGKVTVFVVPHSEDYKSVDSFSDGVMSGQVIEATRASIVIVGDKDKPYDELKNKIKQNMVFSA